MDLSKFLQNQNKHQYGVMYINGDKVTVLDIFETEFKASAYISYISENIKYEGELSLFKVGEPVELEHVDLTSLLDEPDQILTTEISDKNLEITETTKINDKSKIKYRQKKLTFSKKNKRTNIQLRYSRKANR